MVFNSNWLSHGTGRPTWGCGPKLSGFGLADPSGLLVKAVLFVNAAVYVPALAIFVWFVAGMVLVVAARTLWHTSLRHAAAWALATWTAYFVVGWLVLHGGSVLAPWRHLALTLLGCTLVAVLGARWPGVAAWEFVTVGYLAVQGLPFIEQPWSSPTWHLSEPATLFASVVLGVGLLNYLPTRLAPTAVLLAAVAAMELFDLQLDSDRAGASGRAAIHLILLACAVGLAAWTGPWWETGGNAFTRRFARFRDAYGAAWTLRVIEQFNQAAAHANWNQRLTWAGPVELATEEKARPPTDDAQMVLLEAVLKRFGHPRSAGSD